MARFAPMPRARVRTTVRANPGALRSWRTTYGKSCDNVICLSLGLPVRRHCSGELGSRNAIIIIVTQPVEYAAALATSDSIGNAWRLVYNDRRPRLPSIPRHLLEELHVYASGHHQFLVGVGRRRYVGPLR